MDGPVRLSDTNRFLGAVSALAVGLAAAGGMAAQAAPAPVNAPAAANTPPGVPASFADIVEKVAPAVVSVDVEGKASPSKAAFSAPEGGREGQPFGFDFRQLIPRQPGGEQPRMQGTGSGFFISADGYIVTNNHVVEDAEKITVRTSDDRSLPARVIGRDPATDLAVIKVDGSAFPFVSFEERAKPRVGDWVIAVGNPFNLGGTATAGIVSALGRPNVSGSSYVEYMQIDAPVNRGNSGGPSFDVEGRVVGVNTAIFSPSGGSVGIGFDIPADVAASVTRQLISDGKVTRGYIGATVQDVTPEIAESLGVPARKGALVADLTPGGPSARAGLKSGDLVLSVNDHAVASAADLTRQVALARAGDALRLQIRRDGQVRDIEVRSGVRPSEAVLAKADRQEDGEDAAKPALPSVLGMQLAPNPEGGVAIQDVDDASDAGRKGVRQGDVILRAGDRTIVSPADVSAAASQARRSGRKSVLLLISRAGQNIFVPVAVDTASG